MTNNTTMQKKIRKLDDAMCKCISLAQDIIYHLNMGATAEAELDNEFQMKISNLYHNIKNKAIKLC